MSRAIALTCLALTGCLSSASFGSARTLKRGDVSHTIGVNVFVNQDSQDKTRVFPLPMPVYMVRAGFAEGIDFGGRFSTTGLITIDGKWNPLRTEYVDVAIDPTVWMGIYPTRSNGKESSLVVGVDLPLIVDVNLMRELSLVGFGGPGYAYFPTYSAGGVVVRTGGGLHIRAIDGVVIQPEVATLIDTQRGEPIDVAFGVGFSLGDQARFD